MNATHKKMELQKCNMSKRLRTYNLEILNLGTK